MSILIKTYFYTDSLFGFKPRNTTNMTVLRSTVAACQLSSIDEYCIVFYCRPIVRHVDQINNEINKQS